MKKILSLLILAVVVLGINTSQAQIQVLTGTEKGTYFKLAEDMNKLLPNISAVKGTDTVDVSFLDIRTTAGSSINFDLLTDKKHPAKAAFMQLDLLLIKKMDDVLNETKFTDDLVVLMPLNIEAIHLLTKGKTNIISFAGIDGEKIGIGNKMEGTYYTANYIQNLSKIRWNSRNLTTQDAIKSLLLDKVDAFFITATPPMEMLKVVPHRSGDKFKLINLEDVNGWTQYYTPVVIPAGTYNWQNEDVSTFGIPSLVVVNTSKLSDEEKQQLIQWRGTTIESLEELKANGHPAWKTSTVTQWDNSIWPQLK